MSVLKSVFRSAQKNNNKNKYIFKNLLLIVHNKSTNN